MLRATTVRLLSIVITTAISQSALGDGEFSMSDFRDVSNQLHKTVPVKYQSLVTDNQGNSAAARFNRIQSLSQSQITGAPPPRPEGRLVDRTETLTIPDREAQKTLAKGFGDEVQKLSVSGNLKGIEQVENAFAGRIPPTSLTKLIPSSFFGGQPEVSGGSGSEHSTPAPPTTAELEAQLARFKVSAKSGLDEYTTTLDKELALGEPPEVTKFKQEQERKLQEAQQKLAQEQAAADRAAAGGGGGKGGGGNGGGGGGNGGGGDGPKAPKLADGGKGLVPEFDPGKIKPPQEESPLAGGSSNVGEPIVKSGDFNINPMTMSNSGVSRTPASTPMGDTSEVPKGLQLGGAKSTPQSLTMGAGSIPPMNAPGGSGPQGNAPMGAGNGGSGGISGDPYAGVGVEKPYKAQNFNLSKDGGYAKGGGEGGGDGDGASGDGSVDGGGDKAQEAYANVTRPGQYLPRATDNNNNGGFPGIFAYRGYLVKMCTMADVRARLPLCRREFTYQTAKAPSEPATSYIAAVNKETK